MNDNDPLWRLRHALAGIGLALACSVLIAAVAGSLLGDALGGTYAWRAGVYAALLLYVLVGAVVLFVKVAQHETRPLNAGRLARWVLRAAPWLARVGPGAVWARQRELPEAPAESFRELWRREAASGEGGAGPRMTPPRRTVWSLRMDPPNPRGWGPSETLPPPKEHAPPAPQG